MNMHGLIRITSLRGGAIDGPNLEVGDSRPNVNCTASSAS